MVERGTFDVAGVKVYSSIGSLRVKHLLRRSGFTDEQLAILKEYYDSVALRQWSDGPQLSTVNLFNSLVRMREGFLLPKDFKIKDFFATYKDQTRKRIYNRSESDQAIAPTLPEPAQKKPEARSQIRIICAMVKAGISEEQIENTLRELRK